MIGYDGSMRHEEKIYGAVIARMIGDDNSDGVTVHCS